MATYNLTSSVPSASSLKTGDILNCPYSGAIRSVELPAGQYKLLVWGASGGIGLYSSNGTAGKGGYSEGNITFSDNTIIYIVVGGQGGIGATSASGGYNGGGAVLYSAASDSDCGGGGGATHIATRTGLLSSLSSYKSSIYIVAGGGGGVGWNWAPLGGTGGGTSGGDGYCSGYAMYCAYGGTLNSGGATSSTSAGSSGSSTAGSFGLGGNGVGYSDGGAGGGGGYYGGGGAVIAAGGGGSGYISSVLTLAQTIAGNTSFPSTSGSTETGHSGNGYARITVISVSTGTAFYVKISQNITLISKALVKVSDNWKKVQDIYTKVNDSWIKT